MYQLIESIWINSGQVSNLPYHQARYNQAMRAIFGTNARYDLRAIINLQHLNPYQEYKCRITYNTINFDIEYLPYERKKIETAKLMYDNDVLYPYKLKQRMSLDALYNKKGDADEIIIIKNGVVTDAYYFNVVIEHKGYLMTPKTPLLHGVMRQYYIDRGIIIQEDITEEVLMNANKVYLINALNPLEYVTINNINR